MPLFHKADFTASSLSATPTTTALGLNSKAWVINKSVFPLADNTSTSKWSGLALTTSKAWVPIEPVAPKMAIRFFSSIRKAYSLEDQ